MSHPDSANSSRLQARLIANAGKLFSGTTLAALIGVGSFVVTARGLGVAEFGALALVFTYINAVLRLCGFQSWQALINFAAQHASDARPERVAATFRLGFAVDLASCVLACVLAFVLADAAAAVFGWRVEVEEAARLYAFAALFSLTGAPTAVLRYFDRFDLLAVQQVAAAVLKLILTVGVFVTSPSFENFVYAWIVAHIGSHLILIGLSVSILRGQGMLAPNGARVREVVSWAILRFMLISNLDGTLRVVRELDAQVVAMFIDESAAGILRIARQLATFVGRLVDAFYAAIYPDLASLAARAEWARLRSFVARSALQVGAFALVPLAGFALVGEPVLGWVFGEGFEAAYATTLILLGAMVIWGFAQPCAPALLAMGAPGRLLGVHFVAASVYLVLLLVLAEPYSYLGAGWAMFGLYAVWGALSGVSYQRAVGARAAV